MFTWLLTNSIAAFLMPPGSLLLVMLLGLVLLRRRRALGLTLIGLSWIALYALATPYLSALLLSSVEPPYADPRAQPGGQAIVVLGGGIYPKAPEYGGENTVTAEELVRLRYAARLYRVLDKPILVAGGDPQRIGESEAALMKRVLQNDFRVPVRWTEPASNNTDENARFSYAILHSAGIRTIYLVTHAWHMPRARMAFEHAGFTVIPAPTEYETAKRGVLLDFLPSAWALKDSARFFHETIGLLWYRIKFAISGRSA